ncbi:MAG: HAD family hydrolase [Lautropia sp.]
MSRTTQLALQDFKAMTFDVYGTLIDWEPTIISLFASVAEQYGLDVPRQQFLREFDASRAHLQRIRPALSYPDVLRRAYEEFCAKYGIPEDPDEKEFFAGSVKLWPTFEDTRESMKYLARHFRIGLLSNIDDASLAYSHRKLGITADVVVTAQRVGAYKPDHAHFMAGFGDLEKLGISPAQILHVGQSLRADVIPANQLGVRCAWINRPGRSLGARPEDAVGSNPDLTFTSLADLVQMHRNQVGAGTESSTSDNGMEPLYVSQTD